MLTSWRRDHKRDKLLVLFNTVCYESNVSLYLARLRANGNDNKLINNKSVRKDFDSVQRGVLTHIRDLITEGARISLNFVLFFPSSFQCTTDGVRGVSEV